MYCKNCNSYYGDSAKFCTKCGLPCVPNPIHQDDHESSSGVTQNYSSEWQTTSIPQGSQTPMMQQSPQMSTPAFNIPAANSFAPAAAAPAAPMKPKRKGLGLIITLICLCIVFATSTGIFIYLTIVNYEDADYYSEKYDDIYDEYYFFYDNAYVSNDLTYYHDYYCVLFNKNKSFYIFNENLAKTMGAKPCPYCLE